MSKVSSIYQISSFRGGISDYSNKGISGAFKFGKNLDIRKTIDSLTCQQALVDEGLDSSASPSLSTSPSASVSYSASLSVSPSTSPSVSKSATASESPTASYSPSVSPSTSPSATASYSPSPSPSNSGALTTIYRDLVLWFVKGSDGYTYEFGNTGYVYRRDTDGYVTLLYKDQNGKIKGAAEWYSDSGKTYLYWATDKILNRKEMPGRDDWNDVQVVGANLNSADSHMMREAGGSLIIANGGWLALVGYDDSYTNEALDLIPGNIAKTIVERDGRTIVGTVKASDPDKGINGAIDSEVPLAQVGSDGEIYFADMTSSIPVKKLPGGGKVNPGGVCNEVQAAEFFEWEQTALSWIDKQSVGNMALFAVYDADAGYGGIYSYGRNNKNHPYVLNLEYALDVDELGAITNVEGKTLVSYQDGTDFGVKAVDSDNKAIGTYDGLDFKSPVKKPVNVTEWNYAEIFCDPISSGESIEFWYKKNKTGSFVQAKMEDGTTSFDSVGEKKAVFLISDEAEVIEPRVVLNPSGNNTPEIHNIEIHFN